MEKEIPSPSLDKRSDQLTPSSVQVEATVSTLARCRTLSLTQPQSALHCRTCIANEANVDDTAAGSPMAVAHSISSRNDNCPSNDSNSNPNHENKESNEAQRIKRNCYLFLLCASVASVFVTTLVLTSSYKDSPNVPPPTQNSTPPVSTNNSLRAISITTFINGIKLSTGTLTEPLTNQTVDTLTSAEQAALVWLVNDDPLQLWPSTPLNQFRLQQRYALLTFLLQYPTFTRAAANFTSMDNECEWPLVTGCDNDSALSEWAHVVKINTYDGAVLGSTLSPDLGLLSNLTYIDAIHDDLAGSIPSALEMAWTNLLFFDVSNNALTGSLPSMGTSWSNLLEFRAYDNALTGSIPPTMGVTWTNLQYFGVRSNALTGSIPSTLGVTWTNLDYFDVNGNDLTGSVSGMCSIASTVVVDCAEVDCPCCTFCCTDDIVTGESVCEELEN